MLDDLQNKKLLHLFDVFDVNENGLLEQADFEIIAHRLADDRGWGRDSAERGQLLAGYLAMWQHIKDYADRNRDGAVSPEEWLEWHALVLTRETVFNQIILDLARWIFEACDIDGDGFITAGEYARFFRAHALTEEASAEVFRRLDSSGDGRLSKSEIFSSLREFYFSRDPAAPGNHLFGDYE